MCREKAYMFGANRLLVAGIGALTSPAYIAGIMQTLAAMQAL